MCLYGNSLRGTWREG